MLKHKKNRQKNIWKVRGEEKRNSKSYLNNKQLKLHNF